MQADQRRTSDVDPAGLPAVLGDLGPLATVAALGVVAGGLTAAVNSAAPFAHGSWLAAYLVLVCGVSQLVLGAGRLVLPAPRRSVALERLQLVLWNGGTAAVAIGVLAGVAAVVLVASVAVLAALGCFALGGGPSRGASRRVVLYRLIVAALAISVLVGGVLAAVAPGG